MARTSKTPTSIVHRLDPRPTRGGARGLGLSGARSETVGASVGDERASYTFRAGPVCSARAGKFLTLSQQDAQGVTFGLADASVRHQVEDRIFSDRQLTLCHERSLIRVRFGDRRRILLLDAMASSSFHFLPPLGIDTYGNPREIPSGSPRSAVTGAAVARAARSNGAVSSLVVPRTPSSLPSSVPLSGECTQSEEARSTPKSCAHDRLVIHKPRHEDHFGPTRPTWLAAHRSVKCPGRCGRRPRDGRVASKEGCAESLAQQGMADARTRSGAVGHQPPPGGSLTKEAPGDRTLSWNAGSFLAAASFACSVAAGRALSEGGRAIPRGRRRGLYCQRVLRR